MVDFNAPKGTRDLMDDLLLKRDLIIDRIKKIYSKYGYSPLDTPAFEYLNTLRAKAGEEIDKQLFIIEGGKYALRFDLTVPLARFFSKYPGPLPYKRYSIGKVWRYEEPQKGRYREFIQADADIIGSRSMRCEAELLEMAYDFLTSFDFKPKIHLNNRKILDAAAKDFENREDLFRLLDKIDKIGEEKVKDLLVQKWDSQGEELVDLLSIKTNDEALEVAKRFSKEGYDELQEILALVDFDVTLDLFLVRGLGYYTGPIYEIKISESIGTVMAGGRYDNLLKIYGRDSPAVGISLGVDRFATLITADSIKHVLIYVLSNETTYKNAKELAVKLRSAGFTVEVDLTNKKFGKQLEYANKIGANYVIILGDAELKQNKYTVKNMVTGEQVLVDFSGLLEVLND